MLAFLDSPIQLMVVMLVILIVFGPQKLPEIGQQLGRAIRELRRAAHDFSSSINLDDDDRRPSTYEPPRYDNYSDTGYDTPSYGTSPDEGWRSSETSQATEPKTIAASEPPRGDFAAAALSDSAADYGVPADPSSQKGGSP